jgi:hypothetical protein
MPEKVAPDSSMFKPAPDQWIIAEDYYDLEGGGFAEFFDTEEGATIRIEYLSKQSPMRDLTLAKVIKRTDA